MRVFRGGLWKYHMGMIVSQTFYASYHLVTKVALNVGVNKLLLCFNENSLAYIR